jgi:hypothetical protein
MQATPSTGSKWNENKNKITKGKLYAVSLLAPNPVVEWRSG